MEKEKKFKIREYLFRHWFHLVIAGFIVFIFMNKNLSFQIRLGSPATHPPNQEFPQFAPAGKDQKKKRVFTEKQQDNVVIDKMELPSIGGSLLSSPDARREMATVSEATKLAYLKRFAHVAVSERKKFGVPSSIILANGLFHSFAGTSEIATSSNNHFSLKCEKGWEGESSNYYGECYRQYDNAWTSFRDHSQYVTSGRFTKLTKFGPTDYTSWAKGLEQLGFSKENRLAKELIKIIEKYNLHDLDIK